MRSYTIGGGTFSHVRPHLSLAAPAFGNTARDLYGSLKALPGFEGWDHQLVLTRMADPYSWIVTNEHMGRVIDTIVADPEARLVIMSAALCDYDGFIGDPSYRDRRLESRDPRQREVILEPAAKLVGHIRKERKDIFAVGFKTTAGDTYPDQFRKGLKLLKESSLNLVVVNDIQTRENFLITPEEGVYGRGLDRNAVLGRMLKIAQSRMQARFTRSTVQEGEIIGWDSPGIYPNLVEVVDYCRHLGAYKPFEGKTAGHFAMKLTDGDFLTSIRGDNYNNIRGLVRVLASDDGESVEAFGAKPSVGGQSQRQIFRDHPETDCIVHFHAPLKRDRVPIVSVAPQWAHECGSHECGENTSQHLISHYLGDGHSLKAVHLQNHGPNIVFSKNVPPGLVQRFISENWDVSRRTMEAPEQ